MVRLLGVRSLTIHCTNRNTEGKSLAEVAAAYGHVDLSHYLDRQFDDFAQEEEDQAHHMQQMAQQRREAKEGP
jgi:hypothetical protein